MVTLDVPVSVTVPVAAAVKVTVNVSLPSSAKRSSNIVNGTQTMLLVLGRVTAGCVIAVKSSPSNRKKGY